MQQAKHHCSISGNTTSRPSVSQSAGVTYILCTRWTVGSSEPQLSQVAVVIGLDGSGP